jgi:hypothetical protein
MEEAGEKMSGESDKQLSSTWKWSLDKVNLARLTDMGGALVPWSRCLKKVQS